MGGKVYVQLGYPPDMVEDDAHPPLPPLYHACMANDLGLVQKLLEGGADPKLTKDGCNSDNCQSGVRTTTFPRSEEPCEDGHDDELKDETAARFDAAPN